MANPIGSISCTVRQDNARVISWTFVPGMNYPAEFILELENSRLGGPWEVLSQDVSDCCIFVDSRRRNYNKSLNECYRLRLTVPGTNEVYLSDVAYCGLTTAYPFSKEAKNMITQLGLAVDESGCDGVLLKRKIWGKRCPDCTDFHNQTTVNEHCPKCHGTGILGGYYNGIPLKLIKDQIQTSEGPSGVGYGQSEIITGKCIAYPWIHEGDVWIEKGTNKRFNITACTPSATYRTVAVVYVLRLSRLEYTDAAYDAPMNNKEVNAGLWESENALVLPNSPDWDLLENSF